MKPLKILLGNNTLSLLAGSETWTYSLAVELKKLGHSVACFSPELGIIANHLQDEGIPCFSEINKGAISRFSFVLEEVVDHNYDVIIANHNHIVEYLRACFPKTPIISTIHGILHKDENGNILPEHPALESGVNEFVAVSEEVQEILKSEYNIESTLIRNGFDIKKYNSLRPVSSGTPKNFLINSNYLSRHDPVTESIRQAAVHYGATLSAIGINFVETADTTKAINDADVVFGMGRSVLEGVAAGRLGIVYGRWGMGGPITPGTVEQLRYYNFSGRNSGQELYGTVTPEDIIKMVDEFYTQSIFDWSKDYIAKEHNMVFVAEKYVQIARELTGEMITRPPLPVDNRRPFKLAKDVQKDVAPTS